MLIALLCAECAGRGSAVRPAAIAAAVIGHTLGLGLTIIAFLQWRKRRSVDLLVRR